MPYHFSTRKPVGYWTLDQCKKDARKHSTRGSWRNAGGGYQAARKRTGWLDACCKHMVAQNITWDEAKCMADAAKYKTRKEWFLNSSGYQAAKRHGCFDKCVEHMTTR